MPNYTNQGHDPNTVDYDADSAALDAYEAELTDALPRLSVTTNDSYVPYEETDESEQPDLEQYYSEDDDDEEDEDINDKPYNKYEKIQDNQVLKTIRQTKKQIDALKTADPVKETISEFVKSNKNKYDKDEIKAAVGLADKLIRTSYFKDMSPLKRQLITNVWMAAVEKDTYPVKLEELQDDVVFLEERYAKIQRLKRLKEEAKIDEEEEKITKKARR